MAFGHLGMGGRVGRGGMGKKGPDVRHLLPRGI